MKTSTESSREWRLKNPEKNRAAQKKYADAHKEENKARSYKWREAHRERYNEISRKWNYKHLGRHPRETKAKQYTSHAEEMQAWRLANPDKNRASRLNYKARRRGNGGSHSEQDLKELFERQEGKCFYCGELIYSSFDKELHVDHKMPLIMGGTNDISNIALACSRCNLSKHTMTAEEFLIAQKEGGDKIKDDLGSYV